MTRQDPQWTTVAVVGAGTIGLSWAALLAARGLRVRLTDPREDLAQVLTEAIPALSAGIPGTTPADLLSRIEVVPSLPEAVRDVDLVQENGPERLSFKQDLFAEIAAHAPREAVLASSSSGIVASDIAEDLPDEAAARLLIAHPFNPPHVVPLVEVVPGARTAEPVVTGAFDFYREIGKTPVRLRKEVDGFVANRLQSAIMREAISLVLDGVVSVPELDTVMKASLGGRYATIGPFESFHLGGGPGGIRHMMRHLGVGMAERWKELGDPALTPAAIDELTTQTESAYGFGADAYVDRTRSRDRRHNAISAALDSEARDDGAGQGRHHRN
ncbi:3-hydroxyacyl-CoA dehydrogenase NAD-binding domain-containing protein [Saccharopolyspora sp. NFXS83]|uniref:3-hydroxyacyl-CoA dehydrogenase NAD-binding domain-containing protein n=1 Tax=Saccharopolyspora sp. NFXS83 TaxID=2993560 RepID=UPI00224B0CDA|nr:3-hydroxyacyl-CoA dehydrogenase NAD-binding domain-containing protein [Saccharopolyspora sp. NFXS83]MCX2729770.1 3-hydroxyacyl-CoA dehydrogenase NAD-binding domain-containing protein [Saccharopolyspora sp. NFXS83]